MDSARFDALARAFSDGTTRRTLTRLLGGLTLGLLLSPIAGDAKKRGDAKTHDHGTGKPRRHGTGQDTGKDKPGTKPNHHAHDPKRQKARPKAHPAEPTDDPTPAPTRDPADDPTQDSIADAPRPQTRDETTSTQNTAGNDAARTVSASATCRPYNDPCTRDGQCCSGKCSGQGVCRCSAASQCPQPDNPCLKRACTSGRCTSLPRANGTTCDDGQTCDGGTCGCPHGKTACGDNGCVDTQINPSHCGACAIACDGGSGTCRSGVCATPEVCDGVDNDFDGAVDECPANQVCRGGQCGCPAGTQDCDADDHCEQLGTNEHCADCQPCTGGKVCQSGRCVCDETHCGDNCRCPAGTVCQGGLCVFDTSCVKHIDCPANQVCQDGRCATCNQISCGNGCGCLGGSVCEDGGCVPCPTGTRECARDIGGTVVVSCAPLEDCCPSHGNDCPADQVCQEDGQCGCNGTRCGDNCTCASDQVCWDGWCNDPSCFDDAECPHNQFCQNGACVCPGVLCGSDCCVGGMTCTDEYSEFGACFCPGIECGANCCLGGMICQDGQCVHTS